jgi:ABC-type lipoprotein release transport system permease subunit
MEVLIMLLVAAGIFNTLFVSVMERLREFGILMAIGFSPGRLFRLVMWESFWLAVVGLGSGALLTALPYYLGHTRGISVAAILGTSAGSAEVAGVGLPSTMYVGIYSGHALAIGLAVLVATLLAGLYPAWRAGRVEPVQSIKLV